MSSLTLDDIDEIAVELAVKGRRCGDLNRGERYEAIRQMHRLGYSDEVMTHRIGMSARNILRDRQALGLPGVPDHRRIEMSDVHPGVTPATDLRPATSPIAKMLEDASSHESARVRRLGERIEADLDTLRGLLAQDKEKEKARAEVERLERELAAAKARLKGKPVPALKSVNTEPRICVDCGEPVVRAPGQRGVLPKRCQECKGAA